MAIYMNEELYDRYRRGKKKIETPIVTEKEIYRLDNTYGPKIMETLYTAKEVWGMNYTDIAIKYGIDIPKVIDAVEGYKKTHFIGYSKEPVVYVPPWNDIIHIVDEKQLDEDEQKRRMMDRITRLQRSPSPEIAQNIATILTAIDDVQDFTTTFGVGARILEYATKAPHILAEGSFTTGALLNSLQVQNAIPWDKMNPKDILDRIRKKKVDLDTLPREQLRVMKAELEQMHPTEYYSFDDNMRRINPDWDTISKEEKRIFSQKHYAEGIKRIEKPTDWKSFSIAEQQDYMRDHYKITRERWGLPLKVKKRMAEDLYSKGTPWSKIAAEVDKRLKRVLPTHGEMMEIGQTSDQVAGIGISLGPIMGFITDTVFGIAKGAPLKFSKQTISDAEKKVILDAGKYLLNLPMETMQALEYQGNMLMKTAYMVGAGEDLGVEDFLKGMWSSTQTMIESRRKELQHAITNVGDIIKNWVFGPGPHTSPLVIECLKEKGIDPYKEGTFPGVKLGKVATIDEIANAYLERATTAIKHYEAKLDTDVRGEFLASVIHAHALCTACLMAKEGAVIRETFTLELAIYTRAVDYGLEPPVYATRENFAAWHKYILDECKQFDQRGPTCELLHRAKTKYFPPEAVIL